MKKILTTLSATMVALSVVAVTPNKIIVPDIEGYKTLKGDFHIHTMFSDAQVWPETRVQEALWEGLDVIAISDHIDTRHRKYVKAGLFKPETCDRDRSFEIAKSAAKGKDLIVIHGGEISRGMPPGHFNCLFINSNEKIVTEAEKFDDNHEDAMRAGLKEAHAQGGFTMWNHPHWEKHAPNETKWWPIHEEFYKAGYIQGIEIYNECCGYSPEVHKWAIERNITMFASSDAHLPFFTTVDYLNGEHRPVTLVFAKERTEASIREALENQRTAVFVDGMVYGREDTVRPLFEACVSIENVKVSNKVLSFTIVNRSSIPVHISKMPGSEEYQYKRIKFIPPMSEVSFGVRRTLVDNEYPDLNTDSIDVNLAIDTFLVGPNEPLKYTYHFDLKKLKKQKK